LQHPLHVVATADVQQLQNQNVGDCLRPYSIVIASIGTCVVRNCRLRVFGKKKKLLPLVGMLSSMTFHQRH
jgi:hypothetical protein